MNAGKLARAASMGSWGARAAAAAAVANPLTATVAALAIIGGGAWMLSPSLRRFLHRAHSPDYDAPPENPRTFWLPLTHDGNRDGHDGGDKDGKFRILGMDKLMSDVNAESLNYNPRLSGGYEVWKPNPPAGMDHTAVLTQTTDKLAAMATKAKHLSGDIRSTIASIPEAGNTATLSKAVELLTPQVTAMNALGSTVLPKMSNGIVVTGQSADKFYDAFRQINASARREISDSGDGLIPFTRSGIHLDGHKGAIEQLRSHVGDMQTAGDQIRAAASEWGVENNTGAPAGSNEKTPAAPRPGDGTTPEGPPKTQVHEFGPEKPDPDPVDNKGAEQPPSIPNLGDSLPQMPSAGMPSSGMPSSGMPSSAMPASAMPDMGQMPVTPKSTPEGLFDEDEDEDEDLGEGGPDTAEPGLDGDEDDTTDTAGSAAGVGGNAGEDKPQVVSGEPVVSNTADIGDKTRTFDNPKLAKMASILADPGETGGKSVEQAATEAGFKVPPVGQDLGDPVDQSDIQPGDIISGSGDRGVYLGDGDVVTESGEVKKLADIAQFSNPEDGIFRLADDGGPTPNPLSFDDAGVSQSTEAPAPPVSGEMSGPGLAGESQSAYTGTNPSTTALGQ